MNGMGLLHRLVVWDGPAHLLSGVGGAEPSTPEWLPTERPLTPGSTPAAGLTGNGTD